MADFEARIRHKKDTNTNWEKANPILLDGEMILVEMPSGEIRKKYGDGVSRYNALEFDDEKIKTSLDGKVNIQQDKNKAGKVLGIGSDGRVTPQTAFIVGNTIRWGDLVGLSL